MEVSWLVLGVLAAISAVRTEGNGLTITPKLAHVHRYMNSFNISCESSSSVRDCQFRVWIEEFYSHKWDLGIKVTEKGQLFGTNINVKNSSILDYTFDKAGFPEGQCILRMSSIKSGRYFFGCRVRNDSSGWNYAHMAFVVPILSGNNDSYSANQPIDFKQVAVELNKRSSDIEFKTEKMISGCDISYPNQDINSSTTERLNESNEVVNKTTYSARLEGRTTCIASLNVTQSSNGVVWCLFKNQTAQSTVYTTTFDLAIIQALVPPKASKLTSSVNNNAVGLTLTARCTVEDARPVARIVWTLGGDVVRNDSDDDDVDRAWSWPWDVKSTSQVLTLNLTEKDIGKELTCNVFYPNASVLLWSKSTNISKSNVTTIVVIVILFFSVVAVIAIIWVRRKRTVTMPTAVTSNRFTVYEDNEFYQSCPSLQECDSNSGSVRESIFIENPYEELDVPEIAPSDKVEYPQYEEVVITPSV